MAYFLIEWSKIAAIKTSVELIGSLTAIAETRKEVYLDYQNRVLAILTSQSWIWSVIGSYLPSLHFY